MKPSANSISLAVDGHRAVGRLRLPGCAARQVVAIDRQEPAHARALELEQPAMRCRRRAGARRCACTPPNSQSSRSKKWMPMFVATPPDFSSLPFHDTSYQRPRGGDVGQHDVVRASRGRARAARLQRDERRMQPQLQHGVDAAAGLALELLRAHRGSTG